MLNVRLRVCVHQAMECVGCLRWAHRFPMLSEFCGDPNGMVPFSLAVVLLLYV